VLGGRARPDRTIHIFRGYFIHLLIQQFRMPPSTDVQHWFSSMILSSHVQFT